MASLHFSKFSFNIQDQHISHIIYYILKTFRSYRLHTSFEKENLCFTISGLQKNIKIYNMLRCFAIQNQKAKKKNWILFIAFELKLWIGFSSLICVYCKQFPGTQFLCPHTAETIIWYTLVYRRSACWEKKVIQAIYSIMGLGECLYKFYVTYVSIPSTIPHRSKWDLSFPPNNHFTRFLYAIVHIIMNLCFLLIVCYFTSVEHLF